MLIMVLNLRFSPADNESMNNKKQVIITTIIILVITAALFKLFWKPTQTPPLKTSQTISIAAVADKIELSPAPVQEKKTFRKKLLRIIFPFRRQQSSKPQSTFSQAARSLVPPLELFYQYFDFNQKNALRNWEEKIFSNRVKYDVDLGGPDGFVHGTSIKAASAIYCRIKYDLSDYPYLSWKWRVVKFPDKTAVSDPKQRDDYAGRVYVIFMSRFFTNLKCIEYVWDQFLPEETILQSPYSDKIRQIVIQSGEKPANDWILEQRNVYKDYQKLFGEKPKIKVSAIALMTDAEGTESAAEGFFDDIKIGKE